MKKLILLIEDDFELMGNGLGNVAYHQYIPGNFLMNVAEAIDIKLTFMVDVAQQLVVRQYSHKNANLKFQEKLWDETIQLIKRRGFDVQLHLHPQWLDAKFDGTHFKLGNNWNLGRTPRPQQTKLIEDSIAYLTDLLKPVDPNYKVHAYKAGSWGMQPSEDLFNCLADNGIKVVMGVRKGMKIDSAGVDYTSLEEPVFPYFPNYKDINKVGQQGDISIIPLCYYAPNLFTFGQLAFNLSLRKIFSKPDYNIFYNKKVPKEIQSVNGIKGKQLLKLGFRPYLTQLKMSNEPFSYLKKSFDAVYNRLSRYDVDHIPVVLESHTKHYIGNYHNIERFLNYIANRYHDKVEFSDLTTYINSHLQDTQIKSNETANAYH